MLNICLPAKKQHFYGGTQCVTSSGSHAGKLWPLAISWTEINLVSQPMPPKLGKGISWRHETLGPTFASFSQVNTVLKQQFCFTNKQKTWKQLIPWQQILLAIWIRSWYFWNIKSWYYKQFLINASLSSRQVSPSRWDGSWAQNSEGKERKELREEN